ncbi:hypothetical protein RCL_jg4024.t1 [Rhizophagus clarus]|uniref:Uncharacterized protein n=1 Tax=Rhizophagus clarus TaxID=94130 RepID=A0A8H3KSU9_9GLOM|nr:hypothetical protein RCL_jg4024.t1 [Rhizophagus clarus]
MLQKASIFEKTTQRGILDTLSTAAFIYFKASPIFTEEKAAVETLKQKGPIKFDEPEMEIKIPQWTNQTKKQPEDTTPAKKENDNQRKLKREGKKITCGAADKVITGIQVVDENIAKVRHIIVYVVPVEWTNEQILNALNSWGYTIKYEPILIKSYGCIHSTKYPSDAYKAINTLYEERQLIVFFEKHTDMLFALRTSFDIDNVIHNWSHGEPLENKSLRNTRHRLNEDSSSKKSQSHRPQGQNPGKNSNKQQISHKLKGFADVFNTLVDLLKKLASD